VLAQFFQEIWNLFRDTVRHLWRAVSSCARVFLLIVAAWDLAEVLRGLGALIADLWERDSFWLDAWRPIALIAVYILLAWIAGWAVVIVSIVGDKRNKKDGVDTWHYAVLVTRYNLFHSTLVYWFYLSLVLFVSWFVISALRFAIEPDTGFRVGVVFVIYLAIVIILGAWMKRTTEKRIAEVQRAEDQSQREQDECFEEPSASR
jgi:hypothetical protein